MSDVPTSKESWTLMRERLDELSSQLETAKRDIETVLQALNSLLQSIKSIEVTAPDSLASGLDLEHIKLILRNLTAGSNQEEILEAYLRETQPLLRRAILFLQQDDSYVPWKGRGFEIEQIAAISQDDRDNPIVQAVERTKIIISRRQLKGIFPWLHEEAEPVSMALCVPLVFEERVPVVLYGDSSDIVSIDSVELISHLAVLVLKNQSLQGMVAGGAEVVGEDAEHSASQEAESTDYEALEPTPAKVEKGDAFPSPPKIEPPPPAPDPETPAEDVQPDEALEETLILEPAIPSTTPEQEPPTAATPETGSVQQEDYEALEPTPAKVEKGDAFPSPPKIEPPPPAPDPETPAEDVQPDEALEETLILEPAIPSTTPEQEPPTAATPETGFVQQEDYEALEPTPSEVETKDAFPSPPKIEPPPPAPDPETPAEDVQPDEALEETLILEPAIPSTTPEQEPPTAATHQDDSTQQEEDPEEKYHREARRLSRILVSEIRLNKTEKINQGLQSRGLYSHLQEEIDERREAYQSKVHPAVASEKDYYHEEIVSILAAGDESLMGDDYPGRLLIPKP